MMFYLMLAIGVWVFGLALVSSDYMSPQMRASGVVIGILCIALALVQLFA